MNILQKKPIMNVLMKKIFFVSSTVDILLKEIWRLYKNAKAGKRVKVNQETNPISNYKEAD